MDYTDILKRAWRVAWRNKVLWVLGFFAGAGAGGGGGGNSGGSGFGSGSGSSGSSPITQAQMDQFQTLLQHYAVAIVLGVIVLFALGLVLMVLSVAARGGLVHLVNEAEEGRPVHAREGWRVGFAKWWRVFGVGFLAALPSVLIGLVMLLIIGIGVLAAIRAGAIGDAGSAIVGTILGSACMLLVLAVPAIFFGIVLGISADLGIRYVVLEDRRASESLRQGWRDLWSRRGAFVMYLIQVGVGIAYGIVVAIVAAILIVPGILLAVAGAWPVGVLMTVSAVLVLMVPGAAYATFYHAVWTIFFRRMTGMEPHAFAVAPASGGAYPMVPPPPAPPSGYAPTAFAEPAQAPIVPAPEPPAGEPMAPAPDVMPEPSPDVMSEPSPEVPDVPPMPEPPGAPPADA
jgi:hypothetical protein